MNIGKVFREARTRDGASLKTMAKRLGVTPSALWKIEGGLTWPKPKTIEALCREYDIPVARFYIEAIEPRDFFPPQ